ncbi:unnamed protein product [Lactuca saligna]|uniref:Uncharacterized protein n=1 Tax=Lactuca saligna TaxID=75948 RepID=A0AA35Z6J7_LACSI|nr:unnamed protein product [Lactuca saligna]
MGSSKSTIQNYKSSNNFSLNLKTCYAYPMGLGFGYNLEFNFGFGRRNRVRALKNGDEGNLWNFPMVNVVNISPPVAATILTSGKGNSNEGEEISSPEIGSVLLLKLKYEEKMKPTNHTCGSVFGEIRENWIIPQTGS